ncbi:hypothetical protein H6F78_19570 [Coleofasciculus sp. FACHB-64]|uniref:hypothetical protein n=1 Tax=Cyanophyceae TaxID=3028117 RepID=UPI001683F8A2|nr:MULTISPECIES: hypothetical protein [unclassified Coleofasciculus]MBD1841190.1 hypothetical protein [Coleofasciculus sp. FACHB-501]MBD2047758.1 hypothetical protein [Coleofasciculus sp. FACHB-64]
MNKTGKTVYNAKVNYEVLGNNSVIERVSIFTEPPALSPGQTAIVLTFMPNNRNVRTTSVKWNEKE